MGGIVPGCEILTDHMDESLAREKDNRCEYRGMCLTRRVGPRSFLSLTEGKSRRE